MSDEMELLTSGNIDDRVESLTQVVQSLLNGAGSNGSGISNADAREIYSRITDLEDEVDILNKQVKKLSK